MSDLLIDGLSTLSEMKIKKFEEVLQNVVVRKEQTSDTMELDFKSFRNQYLTFLQALGYCEIDWKNRRIQLCPPLIVRLPSKKGKKTLLTGSRITRLLKRIEAISETTSSSLVLSHHEQRLNGFSFPSSFIIKANTWDDVEGLVHEVDFFDINCEIETPAAWNLLNYSASVRDVKNNLSFELKEELNWSRRIFSIKRLHFISQNNYHPSLFLASYRHPYTNKPQHWLWKDGAVAKIKDRNWARYLILSLKKRYILLYDPESYHLAVPKWIPLPALLRRAVALCSGLLPVESKAYSSISTKGNNPHGIPPNHPLLLYSNVPPKYVSLLACKLGQDLTLVNHDLITRS